jgi:hypothetical protein
MWLFFCEEADWVSCHVGCFPVIERRISPWHYQEEQPSGTAKILPEGAASK